MSRWSLDAVYAKGRGRSVALRLTDTQPAAIEHALDALDLPPRSRLCCILAGEGVRYRIVPWRDELSRPAQRQLLAEQCLIEAHGEVARGWTVRQHSTRYGAATLACAIDSALLDRLHAQTQARRLRLVSVQPSLMSAYNAARPHIAPGLHWFVAVDEAWTTLLLRSPTEPLQVKRLPSPGVGLAQTLDREWFALGIEAPRCPVYLVRSAPGSPSMPHPPRGQLPTSWTVVDLTPAIDRSTPLASTSATPTPAPTPLPA